MRNAASDAPEPLAVLVSGGLDSVILLGESARRSSVQPLYIRTGLYWEDAEFSHLTRYLAALRDNDHRGSNLNELRVLQLPVADIYGPHWSLTGVGVPDADAPDEAVYLPGRNLLLLSVALVWCHLHDFRTLGLGTLGSNPFPDATDAFFDGLARLVGESVMRRIDIVRPYSRLHKVDVMQRGRELPLAETFSCIRPHGQYHCGRCNKCAERRLAFAGAGMPDPTRYA